MKRPTTIRLPEETRNGIEEVMRRTGRDFSSVTNEMLEEAVRMRRIPGIVFADGPSGRRARVAGTGIEVFEVLASMRSVGNDYEELKKAYHWLTDVQLRAALAYEAAYPDEIAARLRLEDQWTPEELYRRYPFTRPH